MLDVLSLLNKLNHSVDGLKVPYDTFHLNELSECLDVRVDYLLWLGDPGVSTIYVINIRDSLGFSNSLHIKSLKIKLYFISLKNIYEIYLTY